MKIIYAIVSSDDGTRVTDVLTENHFSVTRLATTGGFLKKGNATLMIGTEAEKVDQAIQLIKDTWANARGSPVMCRRPTLHRSLQVI